LMESTFYRICIDHYNRILEAFERWGEYAKIEEAGLLPQYKALLRQANALMEQPPVVTISDGNGG
jgi:hypothetical protein